MKKRINFLVLLLLFVIHSKISFAQGFTDNTSLRNSTSLRQINQSGISKLINGSVYIDLSNILNNGISNLKYNVQLTPYSTWSGFYVKDISNNGFTVKSEQGDLNASFFWTITLTNESEKKE